MMQRADLQDLLRETEEERRALTEKYVALRDRITDLRAYEDDLRAQIIAELKQELEHERSER